jgi:hypothetical protein
MASLSTEVAPHLSHDDRYRRIEALGYEYAAQPKRLLSSCNLCGHDRFLVVSHRDRYRFPADAHGCLRCGLVFLNPLMTAEAYRHFYAEIYRPLLSAFHGRLVDPTTIQPKQQKYAAERAEFIAPFVGRFRTLLDIGGSTGVVAHQLAERFGLQGTVIDPAPLEIEQARRLGLETITGFVEEHDFADRRYDIVTICQTVDHLLDIAGTLQVIRHLLSATGLLFIDIVDFRAAYLYAWSVEDATKIDHPYYLTEPTMAAYLARAGFDILRVDYAADHLHVGYVCRMAAPRLDALPPPEGVERLWHEIRTVHNAPRPR